MDSVGLGLSVLKFLVSAYEVAEIVVDFDYQKESEHEIAGIYEQLEGGLEESHQGGFFK